MKWLNTRHYPFQSQYFTVGNHRLHYIDVGSGPLLLFVHGTPCWSYDYAAVIAQLSQHYRCIAIDLMGFGLSDKPQDYDYSTPHHAQILAAFVQQLDLTNITLVLHDFGGPIGLSMALENTERMAGLVLLNTWMWSSEDDPQYRKMKKILRSPLLPFLYLRLNFSPRFLLPAAFFDKKKLEKRQYTSPFSQKSERYGALAFARSLLHDQGWFQQLWHRRQQLAHLPVAVVWGMNDPIMGTQYLDKWKAGFPQAQITEVDRCGHCPQVEQPNEVARAIALLVGTGV